MHEERDELCRFVFPWLEDFCSRRNIGFTGIDLRWGVTEEEVRQGKTVGLCLTEIDHCRPYFLGILGERYGWIPAQKMTEEYRKLFREDRSITEAEIHYGALSCPHGRKAKAFFCLRDSAYTERTLGLGAEDADARERQKQLKDRIRKSPYPVLDGYTSMDAFGAFIREQLGAAIEKDFPEDGGTDSEYGRESVAHAYYASVQNRIFTGRERELLETDSHVKASPRPVPLFVTGAPGAGKTAFLARWAVRRQETCPDDFVFMHFYGASLLSDQWESVAKRLIYELCRKFELEFKLPETSGELMSVLSDYLQTASGRNAEIILVLDGIDLITSDSPVGLAWLPKDLPAGVKMLLSVKTAEGRTRLLGRNYREYRLAMLKPAEQNALIASHLKPYGKKLEKHHIARILQAKAAKNPLYLGVLLHELCTRATHDRMNSLLTYYLQAGNATELFVKVIEAYVRTYGEDITRNTLSLLWGARHGLTEGELLSMLRVPQAKFSPLYLALKPYLVNKNGILNFACTALRDAVKHSYLSGAAAQKAIRRRLAGEFMTGRTFHALEETVWLLKKTEAYEKLYGVLSDPDHFSRLWKHHSSEVKMYWEKIESHTKKQRLTTYPLAENRLEELPKTTLLDLALFFFETGYPDEAERLLKFLSGLYPTYTNRDICQRAFGMLGNLYCAAGKYREAKTCYNRKLILCRQDGLTLEKARVYGNLGVMESIVKNYGEALKYYKKAGEVCHKLGFLQGMQADLGNRGNIYFEMKEYDKAMELFKSQEQICRESGHLPGLTAALGNTGLVMMERKEYSAALALFEEQEELCRKTGDFNRMHIMYGNRAKALYESGQKKESLKWLERKLALCERINHFDGQQMALANLIVYYMGKNELELDTALDLCRRRMELCQKHRARVPYAESLIQYAHVLRKRGEKHEADKILRQVEILM
jgi:tetratricopeptide (TPR) repeat protein